MNIVIPYEGHNGEVEYMYLDCVPTKFGECGISRREWVVSLQSVGGKKKNGDRLEEWLR